MTLELQIAALKAYLSAKVCAEDWHAVSDAANDLRVLEVQHQQKTLLQEANKCPHLRTDIWEPHLAGARKCKDCGMVYNPNFTPPWHYESKA